MYRGAPDPRAGHRAAPVPALSSGLTRVTRLAAVGLWALALAAAGGCAPTPAPTPSPAPTSPVSPTPSLTPAVRDFTVPGEGREIVTELVAAAGTINAVKLEISRTEASLTVVSGMTATTWAWRDGHIIKVASDTQYVGQAIFDPRDYPIDNVGTLFSAATAMSGSSANQQLQVVEYNDRTVYVTVTTNPESRTVFFRKDGSLVTTVDLRTKAGISEAYRDTVRSKRSVLALGLATQGFYVDTAAGPGVINRTLRAPKFPARTSSRSQAITQVPFDPQLVDPVVIAEVIAGLPAITGASPTDALTLVVDRTDADKPPLMRFSLNGVDVVTTLSGTVVTG